MRLLIEIAAATLLVVCITATSAAQAADRIGRSADGLSCGFSVPQNATAGRALRRHQAAMRRQILRECLRRQTAVGCEQIAAPSVAAAARRAQCIHARPP